MMDFGFVGCLYVRFAQRPIGRIIYSIWRGISFIFGKGTFELEHIIFIMSFTYNNEELPLASNGGDRGREIHGCLVETTIRSVGSDAFLT